MKKRISVYIDGDIWESAKELARLTSVKVKAGVSGSEIVEDAIKSYVKLKGVVPGGIESVKPKQRAAQPQQKEEATQSQHKTQDEFDTSRKKRDIKKDKIERVKERGVRSVDMKAIRNTMGLSGAYSKEHQTRKRGK